MLGTRKIEKRPLINGWMSLIAIMGMTSVEEGLKGRGAGWAVGQ